MTQKRLAELVGVSRQTMNAIENSRHAPTIDVAIRIADVFGVTVDQLFEYGYDGKPMRSSGEMRSTTVREEVIVEETIDDHTEKNSVEDDVENSVSLASLRNMF